MTQTNKEASAIYAVCIAPGCHSGIDTTVLSVHETREAAIGRVSRNWRSCVVEFSADSDYCKKGYQFRLSPSDVIFQSARPGKVHA